ncbi:MAG: Ribosomal RNA small subunit methyltransferase H [Candidatus Falkowbacteria bacterium GW2011_GWC2_38_22]|uniref:Ribosomal RNA small subunit methyltransferase H n=1 Tax=Candidatus Falkowbacteria bacterium GW2011_GWE1_38_31 TaxID=1618638 RepID=A0A0G0K2D2_9BACT|nr:MAG: Ribosomal RNA small subunit methyltransferase H [Candidatus Falkowbacteria bacterium GW2011_GWF2_38_1205]KKQ60542.1 MAG: Ribosomal RNA small subunit methyltransferase H [Candidatus Falkowbacteria bacterium GW2011_GWC2_38_22]KKQ62661.1 MAG: Ribosomal RNA small subunit methyltransferase H [Candidatus Falkowbacteria bacterium GW2011_GWF1_38_22]KKQ64721.1 MAG: Ribosomal RNA small subunit methyltransferase H [Candidatus Falkowbacteria bacterium GW2011_GWE2_38_254]KKQ69600.1 MAG: Ribosomal RN
MAEYKHIPVMLREALDFLLLSPGKNIIDCTLGGAGYTVAIAREVGEKGSVLAIDLDSLAIENAKKIIKEKELKNISLVQDNFKNVYQITKKIWPEEQCKKVDGIVLDLGLSSAQLADRNRGFSFQLDAPLEMLFGNIQYSIDNIQYGTRTKDIVNTWSEKEIEKIIKEYGEERFARSITKGIVTARKNGNIETTKQLVDIIAKSVPGIYRNNKKIHFATRTFQAMRIATNDELTSLKSVLLQSMELLSPGGRLVVISYHSLEDRIVKHFFRNEAKECICPPEIPICNCNHKPSLKIITKKAILPCSEEIKNNPRARSAKLRVVEKN